MYMWAKVRPLRVMFRVASAVRPTLTLLNYRDSVQYVLCKPLVEFLVYLRKTTILPESPPSATNDIYYSNQPTCWSSSSFIRELIIAWMSGGATGAATAGTGGSGGGGRGAATAGAATGACATGGGGYGTAVAVAGGGGTGSGGAPGSGGCAVVTAIAGADVAVVEVAIGEEEVVAAVEGDEEEAVGWLLRMCL